jgi:gentisate 1,2-dioxygenase
MAATVPAGSISTLDDLYRQADRLNLSPAWIPRNPPILSGTPLSQFVPALWHYEDAKAALDVAGKLIDVKFSSRRNFVMRNPFPGNNFSTARTMVCAYQMILPGEFAPTHRHSSHALRVIIDGLGAYSIVNGEKMPMDTGDVVLTPGWFNHGHGHDGDKPAYWFDGLDVPLTHLFELTFFEEHPEQDEPAVPAAPSVSVASVAKDSPFRFSRDSIRRSLDQARPDAEGFHGRRIVLEAPDIPVMGLAMERLEAGSKTRAQRSTPNHVFQVCEGRGTSLIDGAPFVWTRGDTFVVPGWHKVEHHAATDSVLFDLSDEPLMRFSKYYRQEAD